jgi:hypothetical protein
LRLRTASAFALASLAAAVTVMAVDGHRAGGGTEANSLPHAVIVIEHTAPAPDYPAWWDCEEPVSGVH